MDSEIRYVNKGFQVFHHHLQRSFGQSWTDRTQLREVDGWMDEVFL
jgi:hypothetical protein